MNMKISKIRELRIEMENEIADILTHFELQTGLKPGIIFRERQDVDDTWKYIVNIPVHL